METTIRDAMCEGQGAAADLPPLRAFFRIPSGPLPPGPLDVARLAGLLVHADGAQAVAYVDGLLDTGISLETVYLDLLTPAAQRLGDLWVEDTLMFSDVTIGCCRLQQVLTALHPRYGGDSLAVLGGRRALFTPTPGEQHTLGYWVLTEFFRRAGWAATACCCASQDQLVRAVRRDRFAVVGISVACERHLESTEKAIAAVRRASCNPGVGVLVGGPVFADHPDWAFQVGADATAGDGRAAVQQAETMLAEGRLRPS